MVKSQFKITAGCTGLWALRRLSCNHDHYSRRGSGVPWTTITEPLNTLPCSIRNVIMEKGSHCLCTKTFLSCLARRSKNLNRKTLNICSAIRSPCFRFQVLCAKDEKDHPDSYQKKPPKPLFVMYRGASETTAWITYICVEILLIRRRILSFRGTGCHQADVFSWEVYDDFSSMMPDYIQNNLKQHGFWDTECMWLFQICLLLKIYGTSWRGKVPVSSNEWTHTGWSFCWI